MNLLRGQGGWSLIETMVAMAAGVILVGTTLHSVSSFHRQFVGQQQTVAQQQDLRLALEILEQELLLTSADSILSIASDAMEFGANVHGYATATATSSVMGQTTLSVEDGRGWPGGKTLAICWFDSCERALLAKDGQASMLSVGAPLSRPIPAGASVSIQNRIRYYAKKDERGVLRLMRQVDGGAAVLVESISALRFTYWDSAGRRALAPLSVRRIVVRIELPNARLAVGREFSLRG